VIHWNLAADRATLGLIPIAKVPVRCHYYRPGTSERSGDTEEITAGPGLDYTGGWWRR
jgi:hypothetical protein